MRQNVIALSRKILVIDEDPAFRRAVAQAIAAAGLSVVEAASGRAGLAEVSHWTPDGIVVDLDVSDVDAAQVVRAVMSDAAPRPVIIALARQPSVERVLEVMKLGARDVLTKPLAAADVQRALVNAVDRGELAGEIRRLESVLVASGNSLSLIAEGPAMKAVLDRVDRLASVEMPVLVLGESGTGKGAIARRLHARGPRAGKPMVVVPALEQPGASEAVLFGTGQRPSAFVQAQDGVLFIESIVSLGHSGQDRLARVLADLSAARTSGRPVTAPRLVVAAERELAELVESGAVREELARRLSPLTLVVPPLRERKSDIPALARAIAGRLAEETRTRPVELSVELLAELSQHAWPGNLRELEAAVVRAVALSRNGQVRPEDLRGPRHVSIPAAPAPPATRGWSPRTDAEGEVLRYDDYEAEIFRFALDKAGGCVSRAAEMLGVGRATMYRKMRSYDIDAPPVSERAIARSGRKHRPGDDVDPRAA
jgi:DNA-binding NtrC family response regulator